MEHDEIDLNRKQNNPREKVGRFGVKTNKTLKFDSGARRQRETIAIVDPDTPGINFWDPRLDLGVGISLNAHKNWEIIEKNPLRTSQDDINVNYSRVVDLDFDNALYKQNRRGELYKKVYGTHKNDYSDNDDEEPEYISGTNRKGHFVKQKRKQGKKGVKGYNSNEDNNNNNTKEENKFNSRSSSSSEADSDVEEEKPKLMLIVQRHKQGKIKQQIFHGTSRCGAYNCNMCAEEEEARGRHHDTSARSTRALKALNIDLLNL